MTTTSIDPTAEPWRRNLGREPGDRLSGPRGAWWWTGLAPEQAPGLRPGGTLAALAQLDLTACTRAEIQAYFENGWTLTEVLFGALAAEEAFYRPPAHRLRHPLIFYYGHPACLFVNKLRVAGLLAGPLDEGLERLLETGVDEMSWDDMAKNDEPWPTIDEVRGYRQKVHAVVTDLIQHHPGLRPGATFADESPLWALAMGFEHERIHFETTAVLIRELPLALVQRPAAWPADHPSALAEAVPEPLEGRDFPANPLVLVSGAAIDLGKPAAFPSFGWDNAYGHEVREVAPFEASSQLVSNGEYLAFVADGGYREPRWWSEDGWGWRAFRNVKWPSFWVQDGPAGTLRFKLRAVFTEVSMPWSWPVEVNYHEAKAYAAWCSARDERAYRLPTEAEHVRLRGEIVRPVKAEDDLVLRRDSDGMRAIGRNANLAWGSPAPVDAGPANTAGVRDAMGNAWSWCEDDFHPLPGNRLDPLYDDFSAPCYDGEHTMILGGSFVSTGELASTWARYHFRPHFHQFAGIRLVDGPPGVAIQVGPRGAVLRATGAGNIYETRKSVDEYMLMHHGAAKDVMPWASGPVEGLDFAGRCARMLLDACVAAGIPTGRALDLGCAVGGASFELARGFDEVLGADYSQAFVDAAEGLRRDGRTAYQLIEEGDLGVAREVAIDPAIDRSRLRFERADAHEPPEAWGTFDAVLAANLVDRLHHPTAALAKLGALVRPGGLLLLTTPYTWLEAFTAREEWLGGKAGPDGKPLRGAQGLAAALAADFEPVSQADLPFVIREHARKFQWSMAHATVWRRI